MAQTRTRLTVVLLLILCARPLVAEDLKEAVRNFDEGNRHYRQGEYREAVDRYQRAIDEGFVSGALLFNMGNAYFRLDEIGQAIRYYEKAAEVIPESTALRHNLAIARAQTIDQFSQLPKPIWETWWQWVIRTFGSSALFAMGVAFYLAAAVTVAIRIRDGQSPWRRRILTFTAVLAIVFISTGFAASVEEQTARRAVVLSDEVTLRESPDGAASDTEIHEGLVVHVATPKADWIEIRLPNGVRGWVPAASLGVI